MRNWTHGTAASKAARKASGPRERTKLSGSSPPGRATIRAANPSATSVSIDFDVAACARGVAVEAHEDVLRRLAQLARLIGRERGAERGDGVGEAGLMQRDAVEVALDDTIASLALAPRAAPMSSANRKRPFV